MRVNPNKHESKMFTKHEISETNKKINDIVNIHLADINHDTKKLEKRKVELINKNLQLKEILSGNDRIINDFKDREMTFSFIVLDQVPKYRSNKILSIHSLISQIKYPSKLSNILHYLIGQYSL